MPNLARCRRGAHLVERLVDATPVESRSEERGAAAVTRREIQRGRRSRHRLDHELVREGLRLRQNCLEECRGEPFERGFLAKLGFVQRARDPLQIDDTQTSRQRVGAGGYVG